MKTNNDKETDTFAAISTIDAKLQTWAQARGGNERHWPVLMNAETLKRAGYHEAFPHLLMTAFACEEPETKPEILTPSGWCLSPAVCYHAYASLKGQTLNDGVKFSARGHCFRHEERSELKRGRRQIEFQMRELVLVGAADWLENELQNVQEEVAKLAQSFGLSGEWKHANDPFFLPQAQGKAHMQRLLGTKLEYCISDGLAIASINRHGTFFGERFSISLADKTSAQSACIAFGLDRWASQSTTF